MIVPPDLEAWLTLSLAPDVGGASLRKLLQAFGSPAAVLGASTRAIERTVDARVAAALARGADPTHVRHGLDWAAAPSHWVITLGDPEYPPRLLEIPDPPVLLYVIGEPALLQRPALAIVGSRNPTPQGVLNAREFARAVGTQGITVVSGLALGVDAAAHEGAVATPGATIAVLGTGVDVPYPRRNAALYAEIAAAGALVSEFPLGTPAQPGNSPRRNRLISGLARGCLVVEAALSSGSLITARLAAEQGREVFAIPGSIHSPLARGCHALIKAGAKLVESTRDILEELGVRAPEVGAARTPAEAALSEAESRMLALIGYDPIDLDSLCRRSSLTPDVVSPILLGLELSGHVACLPGHRYVRLGAAP